MKEYVIFRLDCFDADFVVGEVEPNYDSSDETIAVIDPVAMMFGATMEGDEMGILRMMPFTKVSQAIDFSRRNIVMIGQADQNLIRLYERFRKRLPELRDQEKKIVQQLMNTEEEPKSEQPAQQKRTNKRTLN